MTDNSVPVPGPGQLGLQLAGLPAGGRGSAADSGREPEPRPDPGPGHRRVSPVSRFLARRGALPAPLRAGVLTGPDDPRAVAVSYLLQTYLGQPLVADDAAGRSASAATWVVCDGERVVAAGVARLLSASALAGLRENLRLRGAPELLPGHARVGLLAQLVVLESHRRRGVGSALIARRLRWLAAAGCTAVLAESWLGEGGRSLGPLAAAGFTEHARVVGYWDPPPRRAELAVCRCAGVCVCTAVVVTRRLDGPSSSQRR